MISFDRTGLGVFLLLASIIFYLQLFRRQCGKCRKAITHGSLNNTYLKYNFNFIIYYSSKYSNTTVFTLALTL